MPLSLRIKPRASWLTWYPSVCAEFMTRLRVSSEMLAPGVNARETADRDTPACRATSSALTNDLLKQFSHCFDCTRLRSYSLCLYAILLAFIKFLLDKAILHMKNLHTLAKCVRHGGAVLSREE